MKLSRRNEERHKGQKGRSQKDGRWKEDGSPCPLPVTLFKTRIGVTHFYIPVFAPYGPSNPKKM